MDGSRRPRGAFSGGGEASCGGVRVEDADRMAGDGGIKLAFVLEQLHGRGHIIGRVRLSVTDAATPVAGLGLPEEASGVWRCLGLNRSRRSGGVGEIVMNERAAGELASCRRRSGSMRSRVNFQAEGNFKPAKRPRVVKVLRRGDMRQPIEAATPGALSCVAGLPSRFELANPQDEGARRAALAKWITDRGNMLTWRSIVNRVWHDHFGRGIVETPDDFGKMGATPTHPELLDWLAVKFRDGRGSLKRLHRLIVPARCIGSRRRTTRGLRRSIRTTSISGG